MARYGVWERDRFIGCMLFSRGGSPGLAGSLGFMQTELVELTRVALTKHETHVTAIVARGLRLLKRDHPGLRMVVSFADPVQGHIGTIYQAGNWLYAGTSSAHMYVVDGKVVHPKTLYQRFGRGGQSIPWLREHVDPNAERIRLPGKHRYLYPLDRAARRAVLNRCMEYPRNAGEGSTVSRRPHPAGGAGSTPAARSEEPPPWTPPLVTTRGAVRS